jgi:hypothetical protein
MIIEFVVEHQQIVDIRDEISGFNLESFSGIDMSKYLSI